MTVIKNPSRRLLLSIAGAAGLCSASALSRSFAASPRVLVNVWKTPSCGCCSAWITHLKSHGLEVRSTDVKETASRRKALGFADKYGSCHTASVGGYALEGHVPAREIERLLREKPDAIGLAVPGMPMGSPGMEQGSASAAYDVQLVLKNGTSQMFQSYTARAATKAT